MARPRKELDEEQIRELAAIQCTNKEIAAVMRCSTDTLERNYAAAINEEREAGKKSLRRAQWDKAVKDGNPALLIWLGKHYLGQRDELSLVTEEPQVRSLLKKWESCVKKSNFEKRYKENKPSGASEKVG
jgi:hypothetical protein